MHEESLLIIDDLVVPDRSAHRYETQLDLTMLTMLNSEARSQSHWVALLEGAGFKVEDIVLYEEEAREAVIIARRQK